MTQPFRSALVEHLEAPGHSLLVAHDEPELDRRALVFDLFCDRSSLRSVGSAQLRPGRWVHLLVADDYLSAVAAVRSLRASGYAATLGPADPSHLPAWNTRNQPTWVTSERVVCFPWVDVGADALVLEIDPGAAFGTGNHPSTLLLLRWLAGCSLSGSRVLDVGCGTGVLALFAAALGAARIVGIDIDAAAVAASRANALRNGLADRTTFSATPLAAARRDARFDVVVANIDALTLSSLAGDLVAAVAPGGVFAVSGISPAQVSVTAAALRSAGAEVTPSGSSACLGGGDYCALVGSVPCM